jgi:tetratricopeptide (TPR) repeat protein
VSSICLAESDDLNALNQQVRQLFEREKNQEAIPIAERAVEVAKRARGLEQPETASELDNLGFLFQKIGDYAKAEPLSQEALESGKRSWALNTPTRRSASMT